jgi:hypothetical protein
MGGLDLVRGALDLYEAFKNSIMHDINVNETIKGLADNFKRNYPGGKTMVLADFSYLVFIGGGGSGGADSVARALEKAVGGIEDLAVVVRCPSHDMEQAVVQAVTSSLLCLHVCVLQLQAVGEEQYTGLKFMARQQGPKAQFYQQLQEDIEAASVNPDASEVTSDFLLTDRRRMMQDIAARAASK